MPMLPSFGGIKGGESIRLQRRAGLVPVEHMHPVLLTDRRVPPGLSPFVKATLWLAPGDHPAVVPTSDVALADAAAVVTVKDGMVELFRGQPPVPSPTMAGEAAPDGSRFQQLRPVAGVVIEEDAAGYRHDHLVMAGYYILENESDAKVWALSPIYARAWFVTMG